MTEDYLTAEQKKFLEDCEKDFANRFTEADDEFMKVYNAPLPTPPLVDNWVLSNRNQRDWRKRTYRDVSSNSGADNSDNHDIRPPDRKRPHYSDHRHSY